MELLRTCATSIGRFPELFFKLVARPAYIIEPQRNDRRKTKESLRLPEAQLLARGFSAGARFDMVTQPSNNERIPIRKQTCFFYGNLIESEAEKIVEIYLIRIEMSTNRPFPGNCTLILQTKR